MTKENKIGFLFVGICAVASVAIFICGIKLGRDLGGGASLVVTTDKDGGSRALEVVRRRVEALHLADAAVSPAGTDRIAIRLARCDGASIPVVERLCREPGLLSVHLVHRENDTLVKELWDSKSVPEGYGIEVVADGGSVGQNFYGSTNGNRSADPAAVLPSFHAPPKYQFMLMPALVSGKQVFVPYFVDQQPEISGALVERAWNVTGAGGEWAVGLQLGRDGKLTYREITTEHCPHGRQNADSDTGRRLAVVLDNRLLAVFTVPGVVFDGKLYIDRIGEPEAAKHLRNICESGWLRGVRRIEAGAIGPDLGHGAIREILLAVLLGGLAVLVLLAAGLRGSGLVIDVCLSAGVVLLPFGMVIAAGILEAIVGESGIRGVLVMPVLTLWTLAGAGLAIMVSLGLNVAIAERISEELRTGKSPELAVANGYRKALGCLLDTGVAGMIAGLLLFLVGTGQLKGTAVALCAGLISNLLVLIVAARTVYGVMIIGSLRDAFGKAPVARDTGFDFVGKRAYAAVLSLGAILVSWGVLIYKNVDGGQFVLSPDIWQPAWAAVLAIAGVMVWVMLRFGLRYAAGVAAAAAHAVVLTAGLFGLFGHPAGEVAAAALLVVAGGSIYVVLFIFDRARELGQDVVYRRKAPAEVLNEAINRTMRHTLMTCGAALIGAAALLLVCRGPVADFGLVLFIGSLCAAYSSVFIAVPVVLAFSRAGTTRARES